LVDGVDDGRAGRDACPAQYRGRAGDGGGRVVACGASPEERHRGVGIGVPTDGRSVDRPVRTEGLGGLLDRPRGAGREQYRRWSGRGSWPIRGGAHRWRPGCRTGRAGRWRRTSNAPRGCAPSSTGIYKASRDPQFAAMVDDIVGLYLDPPGGAVVLSLDETQIQALDRTQLLLPMSFHVT